MRDGEIDIIASKKTTLVFVEVKTRAAHYFNTTEVITYPKQKKICVTAKRFLAQNQNFHDMTYRFDVALVDACTQKITYIPNAFTDNFSTNFSY